MAELDLSGLTPLDASGLKPISRETPPLDAAGLKRLDVSGLKPLVDTSLTDYPVEFAKGFVEGAKNLPAASLKGAAALQQEIAVQGLQRLDEMERQRTSDMLGQSLDDPFARAAQRTRRSVLGRMTPETIAERREFLTEQANRPLTEHPLYRAGEVIEEFGKETLAPRPGFEGSWTRDIGAGFGSFGAGVATAFLNPAAAALMWVTAGSGEAVENAVKAGATPEQIRRAAVLGTVPGATDAVDAMIPMLGSTGKVMGLLKRVGWGTLKGVLAEGGQEGLQQFLQNLIARGVYDPNKDLTEDVPRSAIIGAIVGGTVGGGFAAAQRQPVAQEPGDSAARGDLAAPGQWWAPEAPPPEQRPTIPSGAIPAETILPPAADAEPAPIQPVAPTAETQPKAETQPIGNAPPEASTGRFVLEALLKDPRTAAEIRADIEQALRWQPSEQWQPVPPLLARPLVDTPDLPFEIKLIDGVLQARLKPPPGSRTAPIELTSPEDVNRGAERTIEPTPAQAEAGNYPKRHLKWQGLEIAIETEAGGTRSGMGKDGVPWSVTLAHPYGYIKRTEGKDGDQIDVYVGPNPDSDRVFIIDQIDPDTRRFDEHKLVIGAETAEQAEAIYLSGFSDGSGAHRLGAMSELSVAELKTWLAEGNNRRPFAYVAPKRPPQRRAPLSLFEFLASRGGIREYRGELATLGLDRVFVPGFGRLVRPSGMPLDRAREAAVEAGYLFDPGWNTDQPSRSTINDLLNLLDQEARGTKVYSANDQEALAERAAKEAKRVAAEHLDLARYRVGEAVAHLGIKNFTDEEERAAVELVLRGADPVDAVVEVVERSAIANEDAVLSSPQETEHADDAGRADTQGAESAAAGEQQTPAVPSPAPRAAPQRLQPPGAESGGGQAQETGAAAEPAGPQRREVKPQPAAPRSAFADMATRIENARRSFINTLVELAGISEAEAAAVTDFYLKKNMAKLDAVGGRITVKHGSYLDPDAIRRALKEAIEQRPSAKPAAPAAQETTAGPSGKRWTAIGKNKDGHTLYEDENGVRSYVENGIRHVEPVPITPTRAGITVIKPEHREPWRLASEIETPQAAEPAAPAKQVEKQEPPSLPAKLAELGGALAGWLKAGRSLTSRVLQEQAEKVLGARLAEGKFDRKDIADALELAVNIMVRDNAQLRIDGAPNAESALSQLDQLLKRLPTQRVRSEEQEALQQFSTPPHYAAAAVYAANVKPGDVVLEPSAGTGSLVAAAMAPDVTIIANELSERRTALLRRLMGDRGRVFTENAEQIHNILHEDVKPTVVVMNPPFSRAGLRMGERKLPMLAAEHIEAALNLLQPGGRLVAIVGRGMTMGAPGYRAWWSKIGKDNTVVANIGVDGKVYEKYGTTFGTRLLVIDKVKPGADHKPVLADAQTVEELLRILEPIRNGRPERTEQQAGEPRGAGTAPPSERAERPVLPASAQPRGLGTGERGGGRLAGARAPRAEGAGEPPVRVEAGKRDDLAVLQPERPGEQTGAGGRPAGGDQQRVEPGERGGVRAERDLEPAGGELPGAATGGERVELEAAAPGKQTGEISENLYQSYEPQRVRVKGAQPHPSRLVESASMASVTPPEATYQPQLPKHVIDDGLVSLAQLEPIIYAGQAHAKMLPAAEEETPKRRGYFIGDGTGVGKGREIAGIILDNFIQGRTKAVWVSEKKTLIQDAKRDWSALKQNPNLIFNVGKVKAGEKIKANKGIAFITYDTLKGGLLQQVKVERGGLVRNQKVMVNGQSGVVLGVDEGRERLIRVKLDNGTEITEYSFRVKPLEKVEVKTRIDQLVEWVGPDFDGVIAFDEAHNMGNAMPITGKRGVKDAAQKAVAGIELQRRLPNARVVYASATGATEVGNLAYATRLGLWGRGTPFASRESFIAEVESGGIAAMELIARDMKQLGLYTARNLSYDGVEYDRLVHTLTDNQREIYDTLAEAWQMVLRNINAALKVTNGARDSRAKSAAYSAFWGAHQRFFNQIITSMQMPSVLKAIEQDLAEGRQAVLQLVNTNEASQERAAAKATTAEEIEELDITPRDQIIQLLERSFPTQQYEEYVDSDGKRRIRAVTDSNGQPVQNQQAVAMRDALIERLASIRVPQGPLDMVLDHFGADAVAEVTGRQRRFILKYDEKTGERRRVEETRGSKANIAETDAFQEGKKKILIFSEAGGTGRSYHADNTAPSKGARRVHYLVQGGWRADKAVQGFGRTHRTNQASAPIFRLVTTDLQGQRRFISSIARRLAQLGALTKGQRQAGDQGIFSARDNLESIEAHQALQQFYYDLVSDKVKGVSIAEFQEQTGLQLLQMDDEGRVIAMKTDPPPITQFLNRILSMKIELQNRVFDAFSERLDRVIEARREAGLLDVGLETIRADKIEKNEEKVVHTVEGTDAVTKYIKFTLSNRFKPKSFEDVVNDPRRKLLFFAKSPRGKVYAVAEAASLTNNEGVIVDYYRLINPVSGSQTVERTRVDTGRNWTQIDRNQAEIMWEAEIAKAPEFITEPLHLITGAILPIWDRVGGHPRVVRLQDDSGERYLGRVVPPKEIAATLRKLGAETAASKVTPSSLFDALMQDARAMLANGWLLKRSRVAGENRIELLGPASFSEGQQVKQDGVFTERIGYQMRYFVPTSKDRGPEVLRKLTEHRPITELTESGAGRESAPDEEELFSLRGAPPQGINRELQEAEAEFVPPIAPQHIVDMLRRGASDAEINEELRKWRAKVAQKQRRIAKSFPLRNVHVDDTIDVQRLLDRLRRRVALERQLTEIVQGMIGVHARVLFADTLPVRQPAQGWGSYGASVRSAAGIYIPAKQLIRVALADPAYSHPESTAYHEAFHAFEHLLATDAEMAVLKRAERRLRQIAQSFAGLSERQAAELAGYEVRAMAFQSYANARIHGRPVGHFPGRVRAIFEKLVRLFERIRNLLDGLGYRTAEDVFADLFEGRMAARSARAVPGFGRLVPLRGMSHDRARQAESVRRPPATEAVETSEGPREQYVLPGAERISDKELAERKAREAKRATQPQKGVEDLPLFRDERGQGELFSIGPTRRHGVPPAASEPIFTFRNDRPLKAHPDYRAAKAGDKEAAARLVEALVTPENLSAARARFGSDVIYAPVIAEEATGHNAIPTLLAELYAAATGAQTTLDIWQSNRAHHTGAKAMERLAVRAEFAGTVKPGARYVLVDDVSVMGSTLAEMANHIVSQGGEIAGVVLLVNAGRSGVLSPARARIRAIERRYGDAIRDIFGIEPSGLTADEADYILNFRDADEIRNRSAAALRERGERLRQKGVRQDQEGGQVGPSQSEDDSGPSGAASDSGELFSLRREPETARDRQRVMQGLLARGQPIDRALRVPFDIFGGITRDGIWKPGAKLFERASNVITGAKFGAEGRFAFLNPYLEAARAGLIDRYGLDPAYVERERGRALDERAVMLQGVEVLKSLRAHNVGPAEARVLQAILTGENVTDRDMAALAEPIRAAIDQLGQEAVALGLVSAESFERNRGTYLHRVYAKYEAEQNGLVRTVNAIMGARRKKIIGDQFRGRGLFAEIAVPRLMRDIPEWHEGAIGRPQKGDKFVRLDEMPGQQQLALDENAAAERPIRTVYWPADRAIPDRYAGFKNQGVWEVRGEKGGKLVIWRDFTQAEREKMGEILDARYTIGKTFMLMAHDLSVGKFYKDIAENEAWASKTPPAGRAIDAAEWSAQRQRYWKHGDIEWVRVPDTEIPKSGGKKRWGALAGMWVREEIWRDLNELQIMNRPNVWRALMTQWKLNKTARSPVVHMNNVMSNLLLMDLLDVRWQDLAAGIRSYIAQDAHYQEALRHGAFGADMISQEVRDQVLKPVLDELMRSNTFRQSSHLGAPGQVSRFVEFVWSKLKALDRKMIDLYRLEDELFRMATYIRRRQLGDTPKQAADHAREQFIDYDIRAPWVNAARNTVLPFISYTYRAIPLVARAIATRPWKLAKYFALSYVLNAIAYAVTGGDEDKERRSLREQEQGFTWIGTPRMLRMPLNDAYGNPIFLDVRRWIPAGDVFDTQGDVPAWLNIGGPLMIGAELWLNRSAFTGREIRNDKTQDWWERRMSDADFLYKSWMPSAAWVPGSWYWTKIADAAYGVRERYSERPYSLPLAVSSSFGVKLKPEDVDRNFERKAREFARVEHELQVEARKLMEDLRRGALSENTFNRQMNSILQKMERNAQKSSETLR